MVIVAADIASAGPLTREDLKLLEGSWSGSIESRGAHDNVVYFSSLLTMPFADGQGVLKFDKTGATTMVSVKDGKVMARLSGQERELKFKRSDGKVRLEILYQAKYREWDQIYTVVLEK
jgi:hypothetical protein